MNRDGALVFFGILIILAFITVQWFTIQFNRDRAQAATKNQIVVQETIQNTVCDQPVLCHKYVAPQAEEAQTIVPVLMYHHIRNAQPYYTARERLYSVNPATLEAQMQQLKEAGYTPISLEVFWKSLKRGPSTLPDRPVLLTFDDGYKNHFKEAYPVLKKFNFPAIFFVYTDAIGLGGYMSKEMLSELASDPHMMIEAHSVTHGALTSMSEAQRMQEMEDSKSILEAIIQKPVTAFSYPYGAFSSVMEDEVKRAGYDMAFRIGPSSRQGYDSRFRIQRIQVLSWDDPVNLIEKFAGR